MTIQQLKIRLGRICAAIAAGIVMAGPVWAQSTSTLDKVLSSKTLRCGVQLDFPPAGFRTPQNEPEGFDVAYCKDMAKALGVNAQIVETPSPERIPSLVSNRIDVLIASTSVLPQRALTVSFSRPYLAYTDVLLTHKEANINSFDDLKGRAIGGVTGTTTEQELRKVFNRWNDPKGKFIGYGSESEAYLAMSQRKIDAVLSNSGTAAALQKSGQFPWLVVKPSPTPADLLGIAVRKSDTDFLRWIDVFVWNQIRTGRYQELYSNYFGSSKAPSLSVDGAGL
jgi:polar amino acid transport system substrate-binding protein